MSEPKNVLFLHRGGSQVRGSEEALLTLLKALDRTRFTPFVLCSHAVFGEVLSKHGIRWELADFPELLLTLGERRLPLRAYIRALNDIVRRSRTWKIDLLCSSGAGPSQLAVPAARRLGIPVACLLHHPAPAAYHYNWLTKWVDQVICTSQFTADELRKAIGKSSEVVHIGVDAVGRFAPVARDPAIRAALGCDVDDVVFAQVGALVPTKGHEVLIEAFSQVMKELASARLLIVGSGPELPRLQDLARALGVGDRVAFKGYVEDTRTYFQHAIDVNVLASHEEGFGLVNIEASACGLPNIATNGTGIRETVREGETGFLYPDGDSNALAELMARLGKAPELRRTMGSNGRLMVERDFNPARYAGAVEGLFNGLIRRKQVDTNSG